MIYHHRCFNFDFYGFLCNFLKVFLIYFLTNTKYVELIWWANVKEFTDLLQASKGLFINYPTQKGGGSSLGVDFSYDFCSATFIDTALSNVAVR